MNVHPQTDCCGTVAAANAYVRNVQPRQITFDAEGYPGQLSIHYIAMDASPCSL